MDDNLKMNGLQTMVTGKAKEAVVSLGYTADMYNMELKDLVCDCGETSNGCEPSTETN